MSKDCRDTALSFLEHRERSTHEVRSHLRSKGFRKDEIEEEMKCLEESHYVDDARYCRSYIDYGIRKGRGPVRLRHELAEKGVDSLLIQEIIDECFDRDTEEAAAMREIMKLLERNAASERDILNGPAFDDIPDLSVSDEKTIGKICRRLASQGYRTGVIYDIVGRLRKP